MENRHHFIFSNREVRVNRWTLNTEVSPFEPLNYVYYRIPKTANETTKVSHDVTPISDGFMDHIVEEAKKLPATCRNVTIYIHGFHHISNRSYKIDLFKNLVNQYCSDNKGVGKFVFLSWPATGFRNTVDDMAHAIGAALWRNPHFDVIKLHDRLNKEGIKLYLWAHSFGHRILNGYLSEQPKKTKLQFDKLLLFASDIPYKSLDLTNPGIRLGNEKNVQYKDYEGELYDPDFPARLYDLSKMETASGETHCYYCKYDRMMLASTEGQVTGDQAQNPTAVDRWICVGSVSRGDLTNPVEIVRHDVTGWVKKEKEFKKAFKQTKVLKDMDATLKTRKIVGNHRMFAVEPATRRPWLLLHQYLVMSPSVVKKVKTIL